VRLYDTALPGVERVRVGEGDGKENNQLSKIVYYRTYEIRRMFPEWSGECS
jgi:hypothetical protein